MKLHKIHSEVKVNQLKVKNMNVRMGISIFKSKIENLRSQNKKGSELLSFLHHMTFVHLSFRCNLNKYVKMEDTLVGKQKHKFVACVFFNFNLKTVGQKSPGGL